MAERKYIKVFSHSERMKSKDFVEKVNVSEIEYPSTRGRPLGKWKDRVKEYMCERGASKGGEIEKGKRECVDRKRWRLLCRGHPLGRRSRRKHGIKR